MASVYECKPLGGALSDYFKLKPISKGSFGSVYQGRTTPKALREIGEELPEEVAIKVVALSMAGTKKIQPMMLGELHALKHSKLAHGIRYYGCFLDAKYLYIIMNLVRGQTLYELIRSRTLTQERVTRIARELSLAIEEFHDAGFIHRDLKLENIIVVNEGDKGDKGDKVDKSDKITLIDYGFMCAEDPIFKQSCESNVGTVGYNDPKVIPGDRDSMMLADWWAFGQIVMFMYLGSPLHTPRGMYNRPKDVDLKSVDRSVVDILSRLADPTIEQSERPDPLDIIAAFDPPQEPEQATFLV